MDSSASPSGGSTRREFLKQVAVTTVAMAALSPSTSPAQQPAAGAAAKEAAAGEVPWHQRTYRFGQTNITEADCPHYDVAWWRQHWKRTEVQAVIINAGGIFAYYPSKFPLHYRPPQLGDRDVYGELAAAAHEDGISVVARMDSSKAHEPLYRAHPDWFAVDADGQPYRSGEFYLSCVNSDYYDQFLPDIMREIIQRSKPQGLADNIWHGIDRGSICHCKNCVAKFHDRTGKDLPTQRNWNDPVYRQWIQWNYARRMELWDANNRVTREAGGKDCLWIGMNGAGVSGQAASFRDIKAIAERSEIFLLDSQSRSNATGFAENAHSGKLIHGVLGWDKIVPESMAMYQHGAPQFRLSAKPKHEVRGWMLAGFAGGIQPWWHHVGAYDEDRRVYQTAEPVMKFHREHEQYLIHRRPIATVAVGWSQQNADYFGRDSADEYVEQPSRGFTQALVRARIPYVPVHLDHIEREAGNISVLILPNIGAMSDAQIAMVRKFVASGGALIATGQTSLFDEWGDPRRDFALADLLGVSGGKPAPANPTAAGPRGRGAGPATARHTYLRLTPELRAQFYGPKAGDEPTVTQKRHAILAGFDETDILPFGGTLQPLTVATSATTLLTFVPEFEATPPEISYMRQPRTSIPGLVISENAPGRVAYLAADIDRLYSAHNFPDHGDLLANIIRWAAKDTIPLDVQGPGLLNCELYRQPGRIILHVLNLTSAGTWRAPVEELIPVGPMKVAIKLPADIQPKALRMLVSGEGSPVSIDSGWARFEIKSVLDHELVVLES